MDQEVNTQYVTTGHLVFLNKSNSCLAEFPISVCLSRIANNLLSLRLELDAQPKVYLC